MADCPFCDVAKIATPVTVLRSLTVGESCHVFEPLGPVTPGHVLVAPVKHADSAADSPRLAAAAMDIAAYVAAGHDSANIITSIGAPATQTVRHLHIHVVPRRDGDGLQLPWTV